MRERSGIHCLRLACIAEMIVLASYQSQAYNSEDPMQQVSKRQLTSAPARAAAYDPLVGAPLCHQTGSSCDTGDTLIAGVGGYEQNSPNTIDSCSDQSAAIYQQDESLDRIKVNSKDGDTMTAGAMLEIHATVSTAIDVSSRSHQGSETMHMHYHSQSTGTWQHLCTKMSSPGVGNVTLSCDFEIPAGNYFTDCGSTCGLQMVRVNYGYAEYAIEACTETGIWVSVLLNTKRFRH